jgi:hypothetical protein
LDCRSGYSAEAAWKTGSRKAALAVFGAIRRTSVQWARTANRLFQLLQTWMAFLRVLPEKVAEERVHTNPGGKN